MRTPDEIVDEIHKLEAKKRHQTPSINDVMNLSHLNIVKAHIELFKEGDRFIDDGREKTRDYDRRCLSLIQQILAHTKKYWNIETNDKRKGALNNLVRTALLLSRQFTSLYNRNYCADNERVEETNIWRNMQFLVQYQITTEGMLVDQSLPISTDLINEVLRELLGIMDTVLKQEIRVGLKLQEILENNNDNLKTLPPEMQRHYQTHDQKIRQVYRDPHCLPLLEAIANYGREQLKIANILEAIARARNANINVTSGKMSFLRQLQIIGECCTGKNISDATKLLVADIDWQLFVRLRNKLSHNEWDIYPQKLQSLMTDVALNAMKNDLVQLEQSMLALKARHDQAGISTASKIRHYDPALYAKDTGWHLRPDAKNLFLGFLDDCQKHSVITDIEALNQLKKQIHGDIQSVKLLDNIQSCIIEVLEGKHPKSGELKPRYATLASVLKNEKKHHSNTSKRNQRKLSTLHASIRSFNDNLDYSEDTYKQDYKQHRFSFSPLKLIALIEKETESLKTMIDPLPGSDALKLDFPEDGAYIPHAEVVAIIFTALKADNRFNQADILQAEQYIKTYCQQAQMDLHLNLDGYYGIEHGEFGRLDIHAMLENLPALVQPIIAFSKKTLLYTSLLKNPDVIDAAYLHMARIQKYMMLLTRSDQVETNQLTNLEEFKAFRNFAHHSADLFEAINFGSHEFMTRYAALFISKLQPTLAVLKQKIKADSLTRVNVNSILLNSTLYNTPATKDTDVSERSCLRRSR